MGTYISVTELNTKPIDGHISRASWDTGVTGDLVSRIAEAENYVEGRLIQLGYTRTQLGTASLMDVLCLNYARYCVLRDIFGANAPTVGGGDNYDKWKQTVDDMLKQIEDGSLTLTDSAGAAIRPTNGNAKQDAASTTESADRVFSLGDPEDFEVKSTNYDTDVVGVGGVDPE